MGCSLLADILSSPHNTKLLLVLSYMSTLIVALYCSLTRNFSVLAVPFTARHIVKYISIPLSIYIAVTTLHRFYVGGPIRVAIFLMLFLPYLVAFRPFTSAPKKDITIIFLSAVFCTSIFHYAQRYVWQYYIDRGSATILCAAALAVAAVVFAFIMREPRFAKKTPRNIITALAGLAAVAAFLLWTVNVRSWTSFGTVHNWGVFIDAAERTAKGFVPLFDFPLQYGFGPLVMTLAGCAIGGCWSGFYVSMTILSILYFVVILLVLRQSAMRKEAFGCGLDIVVALLATTLWIGVPWNGFQVNPTPSVGGVRFLPMAAMILALFRGWNRGAYAILAASVWWSPDALVMNTLLLGGHELFRLRVHQAILRIVATILAAGAMFVSVYVAIWHIFPDPLAYLEYLIHVPGAMAPPVDGSMWILFGAFLLGIYCLGTEEDLEERRRHLLALYGLLGASLYCLGRSHSQNFVNVMPYLVIVAYRFFGLTETGRVFLAIRGQILTCLLLGVVFVHWPSNYWNDVSYDIQAITRDEETLQNQILSSLIRPANAAVMISSTTGIPLQQVAPKWMPLDSWASYRFIPPARRNIYLSRWISRHPDIPTIGCYIFDDPDAAEPPSLPAYSVLDGFDQSFAMTSNQSVGTYRFVGLSIKGRQNDSDREPCVIKPGMRDILPVR